MTQLYTLEIVTLNINGTSTTKIDNCTKTEIDDVKSEISNSLSYRTTLIFQFDDDYIYIPYELVKSSIFKIFCYHDDSTQSDPLDIPLKN